MPIYLTGPARRPVCFTTSTRIGRSRSRGELNRGRLPRGPRPSRNNGLGPLEPLTRISRFPRGKTLLVVSYQASSECVAYIEPLAVGDELPDMALFLALGTYTL